MMSSITVPSVGSPDMIARYAVEWLSRECELEAPALPVPQVGVGVGGAAARPFLACSREAEAPAWAALASVTLSAIAAIVGRTRNDVDMSDIPSRDVRVAQAASGGPMREQGEECERMRAWGARSDRMQGVCQKESRFA